MKRADYLRLFERIGTEGAVSQLHWATGPRAGSTDPWDPAAPAGTAARGFGPTCRRVGGSLAHAETLMGRPRAVIAGAGHVGQAVAQLTVLLGFDTVVVDERPEFADLAQLPGVDTVLCGDYGRTLAELPGYANTYFVLVTPGHRMDRESAAAALRQPHEYVGMIGSRGKVAAVREALVGEGLSPAVVDSLHAPIGLPLGGREPAEIAVSIAAEIVSVRAQRGRHAFDPRVADAIVALASEPDAPAVLATVVGAGGSVPRGAGSRMLVTGRGRVAGSVGGGAVEAAAIRRASDLLEADAPETDVADYELSNREGADLGMICGGRVKVLFERI